MVFYDCRGVSEVGEPGQTLGGTGVFGWQIEGEADRVGCVVWDRDRGHLNAAELERGAGLEELPVWLRLE